MRELSAEEAYEEPAHELVERLMVAANEAVAKWLENRGMPALYRCHEAPEEESLLEIEATARAFGYNAALPRPCTPIAFAAFCEQISKSRHASALWDVVGSALERASYQVNNTGHFGLGSESYVHFTSPLRRYADLLVHRVVKSVLNGNENVAGWQRTLISMEDHITETSERASWAERDARAALSLRELKNQPRRKGLGVVRGLNASQVRVRIAELGEVDGVIPVRRLRGGYGYDPVRRELVGGGGSITIGDELMVKAGRIDPVAGALELQVVEAKKNERAANGRGVQPTARKPRPSGATGGRPRGRRGGRGRGKKQTNGQ
jgi:ribonuclease R